MRVIKKRKLQEFYEKHNQAKKTLLNWFDVVKKARWRNIIEMQRTFSDADEVRVKSGRKAVVFDIMNNKYRLITAVHYEKSTKDLTRKDIIVEGKVYLFFFMTHAEYDKELWKKQL